MFILHFSTFRCWSVCASVCTQLIQVAMSSLANSSHWMCSSYCSNSSCSSICFVLVSKLSSKANLLNHLNTKSNNCLNYNYERRMRNFGRGGRQLSSVFLRIQVRASSQTKGLERGWKQRARMEKDARLTRSRFSRVRLTPRFTDFFTDFEKKKPDCFAV